MEGRDNTRDFSELSVEEQILHVQDLWDRIAQGVDGIPLTEGQATELDRRLTDHENNPGDYTTWPELRKRLQGDPR
jgi:putative addiction module component (TIGR02574 family)